jgi:hypothetical protein
LTHASLPQQGDFNVSTFIPKSGNFPRTGSTYVELENFLAGIYLALAPFKDSKGEEHAYYEEAMTLLDGFAERHGIRKPAEAAAAPRPTKWPWGQPRTYGSTVMLVDSLHLFSLDFRIGDDPESADSRALAQFARCLLRLLQRRNALRIRWENKRIVGIDWRQNSSLPLETLFT